MSCYYTNGLLNNGSHTLDALRFLLNDTVGWVAGVENTKNATAPFGINIDGLVGFTGGTVAALQSLDNNEYIVHDFMLWGTEGVLTVRETGFRFEWVPIGESKTYANVKEPDWERAQTKIERRSMIEATTAHIVESLDGAVPPEGSLYESVRTLEALDALARSAAQGGVRISLS